MVRIKVSYENDIEKIRILEALKKEKIKDIKSTSFKVKGYYKMYIEIE